jgi:hypothetical protein
VRRFAFADQQEGSRGGIRQRCGTGEASGFQFIVVQNAFNQRESFGFQP